MAGWLRRARLSEIYMWAGAIFVIGVVIVTEFNRAQSIGQTSPWSAFFPQLMATLTGATIAGFVAFGINRKTRSDIERDAAIRLIIKLKLISDDFHSVVHTLEIGLVKANEDKKTHLKMWERVRPVVGLGDPHLIAADEAAAFLSRGQADIANRALLLAVRHRTFLSVMRQYNELRISISSMFVPTSLNNGLASSEIPPSRRVEFMMRSDEIEALIRELLSNARKDRLEARVLCDLVGPAAQRMFNDRDMPTLQDAE